MPPDAVVIVADAHLGRNAPGTAPEDFHRFLRAVPELGRRLIVNGDLFEFWFEYRRVVPRDAFRTLAELAALRRQGVELTVTGGNHDRWGGSFWREEVDAEFHRFQVETELAGWRTWLAHGDRLYREPGGLSRVLQAVTHFGPTERVFRWLHPDLGIGLVRLMTRRLPGEHRSAALTAGTAARQSRYAHRLLERRPELALVVMGHTHRPALEPHGAGRWYLNPGAWSEGRCYAVIDREGPRLAEWPG